MFYTGQDGPYYFYRGQIKNADTAYIVLDIDIFGVGGAGRGRIIYDLLFTICDFQGIRSLTRLFRLPRMRLIYYHSV